MSKIEIGRWSDQLRRMFGMAGVSDVSADLSPEVTPVVVLEQPGVDLDFFKALRWCYATSFLAGAVGFTSKVRMRNPAESGVIAVIQRIEFSSSLISDLSVTVNNIFVDLSTPVVSRVPDSRWGPITGVPPVTTLVLSAANDTTGVPGGSRLALVRPMGNVVWAFTQGFAVLPGVTVEFGCSTLAASMRSWACWTERGLPELER